MSLVPPIYKVFEELSADERFDSAGLELHRVVNSIPPMPRYEILVETIARGDVANYATLLAALADFASKHDLDIEMDARSVTLTPRG
jgi:hypothetical protein